MLCKYKTNGESKRIKLQKAEGNTLAYKYSNVKLAYIQWHRCMDLYSINAPNYVFFKTWHLHQCSEIRFIRLDKSMIQNFFVNWNLIRLVRESHHRHQDIVCCQWRGQPSRSSDDDHPIYDWQPMNGHF